MFSLLLDIGIVQSHDAQCRKRSCQFQRQLLADFIQFLGQRVEIPFYLLCLLLEFVGVGSDFNQQVGDAASGHIE